MKHKLQLRRQSQRDSIRKQQNKALFQKRRLQLLQSHSHSHQSQPYFRFLSNTETHFDSSFLHQLLEFSAKEDTEKGYMLLGNYIIDHINEATKIGFEFFRNRWSERSYYAWVVRLLLEAKDVDMEDYLEQFDRFVISEDSETVYYGLMCLSNLVDKGQQYIILKLPHLRYIIKQLCNSTDKVLRRSANQLLICLLNSNQTARQVLIQTIGVNDELLQILCSQNQKHRRQCLQAILCVFQKSLCTISDFNLFKQLAFIHCSDLLQFKLIICKIYLQACQSAPLMTVCQLLESGMKNVLTDRLCDFECPQLTLTTLKTIQAIYERFMKQNEEQILWNLKNYWEGKFRLSEMLAEFVGDGNEEVARMAQRILAEHYCFQEEEENLVNVE